MERFYRPVVGVNEKTGDVKRWDGLYRCGKDMGVAITAVAQALARGGAVKGWKIYDTPENIDAQIEELRKRKDKVRRLLSDEE